MRSFRLGGMLTLLLPAVAQAHAGARDTAHTGGMPTSTIEGGRFRWLSCKLRKLGARRSWVLVLSMARRSSASFPIVSCLAVRDQNGRLANFRMQLRRCAPRPIRRVRRHWRVEA